MLITDKAQKKKKKSCKWQSCEAVTFPTTTLSVRTPAMIYAPRFPFVMGFNDTGKMTICNMEHVFDVPSYLWGLR